MKILFYGDSITDAGRDRENDYTPEAYGAPAFTSTPGANFEEIPNDGDLPF